MKNMGRVEGYEKFLWDYLLPRLKASTDPRIQAFHPEEATLRPLWVLALPHDQSARVRVGFHRGQAIFRNGKTEEVYLTICRGSRPPFAAVICLSQNKEDVERAILQDNPEDLIQWCLNSLAIVHDVLRRGENGV